MKRTIEGIRTTLPRDLIAGVVVFLVALPLCLGVALASNAPPLSGIIAGIVGGILVGCLSGSQTSVSGPAAGLTAVVAVQIATIGSFQGFLVAVVMAGVLQIIMGVSRFGSIADFFPTCVIKGLLAAIGVILILKQIPHLFGHDTDPPDDMSFIQPTGGNTFISLYETAFSVDFAASLIGFASLAVLIAWDRFKPLKKSVVPAPLIVVLLGVAFVELFRAMGGNWRLIPEHLVTIPVAESLSDLKNLLAFPDFSVLKSKAVYVAAFTVAAVASLETLLNLEAVDKLDPQKRTSPPNRELIAQGVGNVASGLLGGLPVTSVIVRSSVNINAGGKTKFSAIFHGILLMGSVALIPGILNRIPLSCLAAILIVTGYKLANPKILREMWRAGWNQFLPFIVTVVAIIFTDLLIGVLIGLAVSIAFILGSNLRRPLWRVVEKHVGGEVLHIQLASQVSFLNRAMLSRTLDEIPAGQHVLIDARDSEYIDPDILQLIREFELEKAPAHGVHVSLLGFRQHYEHVEDKVLFADYTSRELRNDLTPAGVLQILRDGNARFASGTRISRDLNRQMTSTSTGQYPMAAVLGCIDSRAPTELLFDLGLGDVLTVRIAGNVGKDKVIGSLEYAVAVAGVKLVVVMGHTKCGAVTTAVELVVSGQSAFEGTGCTHLNSLIDEIQLSVNPEEARTTFDGPSELKSAYIDNVARRNVSRMVELIKVKSESIRKRVESGSVTIVGCFYDVSTGKVAFDLPT